MRPVRQAEEAGDGGTRHAARLRRVLAVVLPLGVFALAMNGLHHLAAEFRFDDVVAAFRAIPGGNFALAALFATGSYLMLTQYEWLAAHYADIRLTRPRVALTAFMAYAIGHNVGVSAVSGGAIRYRMYSTAGVSAAQIAQLIAFGSLTFGLGATTLVGLSLLIDAGRTGSLLHASEALARVLGVALLLVVAGWSGVVSRGGRTLSIGGMRWHAPDVQTTLAQIGVASLDLLFAAATLYVLLPAEANVSFPVFAGLFVVGVSAGVASAVPGGLGVFEAVFVLLLPGVPPEQLLGVLLAYRLVYYVAPFVLAVLALIVIEMARQRQLVARTFGWTVRSLGMVAPQGIAFLTFGAGLVLLLSGSSPGIPQRIAALERSIVLPVLELSHLVGSAIGIALLILARGLYRRLDGAWLVACWLLAAGIAATLLKGLDWEEAGLLAAVLGVLLATRDAFRRRASLLAEPLSGAWLLSLLVALGASVSVGLLAYRQVPYSGELWWQFAFDADAPRMLRGLFVAALVLGAYGIARLLAPAWPGPPAPSSAEVAPRIAGAIAASCDSQANLALLGDKALLWSASGRSFVMYAISGRTLLAMGDPIAIDASERRELIWSLRELADRYGRRAAFYEVGPEFLPDYIDAGFALSKLGEEARVPLPSFALDGAARAPLRQSHRRAQRDGLTFRVAPATEVPALLPDLRSVSAQWLEARATAEKGFSLGYFDEAYLANFPIALACVEGRVVAFANLWSGGPREELSIDLMRHADNAPRTTMDFLFIETMLWGRDAGYGWFSLGMAPLAGLQPHPLAPAWHRVGRLIYRLGGDWYNFEGLRAYKEKFLPQWRPRYLAAPGGMDLARVLLDATRLISGGLGATVRR